MDDSQLKRLLYEADEGVGHPMIADGLAERIRKTAHRRRGMRVVTGAFGIVIAALVIVSIGVSRQYIGEPVDERPTIAQQRAAAVDDIGGAPMAQQQSQDEIARLRAELAALRQELDARTKVIERLQKREKERARLAKAKRRLAQLPDALEEVRAQAEKAALIIVNTADHKYNELKLEESAIADYRRAIELCPKTQWAAVARERLSKIETETQGESL